MRQLDTVYIWLGYITGCLLYGAGGYILVTSRLSWMHQRGYIRHTVSGTPYSNFQNAICADLELGNSNITFLNIEIKQ